AHTPTKRPSPAGNTQQRLSHLIALGAALRPPPKDGLIFYECSIRHDISVSFQHFHSLYSGGKKRVIHFGRSPVPNPKSQPSA
ncbi:MAG: hypothetical protein AAGD25_19850, partial [Cyanobacteria bacterium P01_F01_bin.150]